MRVNAMGEFEFKGKTYVAFSVDTENYCEGCAFQHTHECWELPDCGPKKREDGRDVIFLEKRP